MSELQSINPYSNKVLNTFKQDDDSIIDSKINQVHAAYKEWKQRSYQDRANILLTLASYLRSNKEKWAEIASNEMGKLYKEGISEVEKCAWVCEYYALNGESFLQDHHIIADGTKSFVHYQPLGPILGVMPWNFPYWQVFRFCAPTLMAGNTVLMKHASNVPQCAIEIEKAFNEIIPELPIYRNLIIDSSKVAEVISNPVVRGVSLTGSEFAGSKVAECAGKHLKPSLLELGGSDPFIVLNEANLEDAVNVAVQSRMINNGQSCIAAKRFIVEEGVYDAFVSRFKEKFESLKFGAPLDDSSEYSVMAREDLAKELEDQINDSVKEGAELVTGGKREGAHLTPTILTNVQKGMRAYSEELFGPAAVIYKVSSPDEAIALANDSEFGLGGSVWTSDMQIGEYVAKNVETGAMFINGLVKSDPRLPFGGIKNSGYGRELSENGIKAFVNRKTIWEK